MIMIIYIYMPYMYILHVFLYATCVHIYICMYVCMYTHILKEWLYRLK